MYRYEDAAFIAHPRTASVAAGYILKENGWRKPILGHHEIDPELPKTVISVIRETEDWIVSWYYHVVHPRTKNDPTFADWLPGFLENPNYTDFTRGFHGLPHTTHLIFYDRLQAGFDAVFDDLGLKPVVLPHLNVRNREKRPASDFFTDSLRNLLDKRQIVCYDSYRKLLGDQKYLRI